MLVLTRSAAPVVPHAPRTISYPGYAIEVSPSASYIEMGTIEPILPPSDALDDEQGEEADARVQSAEFTPPPMFPKMKNPFTPLSLSALTASSGTSAQIKSPIPLKALQSKLVPPLPPRAAAAQRAP